MTEAKAKENLIMSVSQNEKISNAIYRSIRTGGVFKIIVDSILSLFEGSISWRVKNMKISFSYCESSDGNSVLDNGINRSNARISYKTPSSKSSSRLVMNQDRDAQFLLRILNALLFKLETEISNDLFNISPIEMNNTNFEESKFYLNQYSLVN